MGNPCGAGLMGMMMSAGLTNLCGEAAVCLVEQGGDPSRAMEAMGERDIGRSTFMSMAGAGLTSSLGVGSIDTSGLSTDQLITAYAKQELIKASVNATLAVTIEGRDLNEAMLQGLISAGISTASAFGAHKIGDLRKPTDGSTPEISGVMHKTLHTGLGAVIGGLSGGIASSLSGGTFADGLAKSAASGGFGALVGTLMTEAMVDDKTPAATAQRITQMSDLITTTSMVWSEEITDCSSCPINKSGYFFVINALTSASKLVG